MLQTILGRSAAIVRLRDQIKRVASGRVTVLITGETGTGKELVARALHQESTRTKRALVCVNCAALPGPLLESELFGHEQGAFTGAWQRRVGRFEQADGGTLFLDEVGDMHLRTQAKVLRALQEQEFERLGSVATIRVDVRLIAATNQDLGQLIARGAFREDLYFRLHVVSLDLPPLRDRVEDIPFLARHFLQEIKRRRDAPVRVLAPDALEMLCRYPWPGNVRELENTIERAALMSSSSRIQAEDLGLTAVRGASPDSSALELRLPQQGIDFQEIERRVILQALERSGWVQKDAAGLLRMSRRKLNYRIRRLGITHPGWRRNSGNEVAEKASELC